MADYAYADGFDNLAAANVLRRYSAVSGTFALTTSRIGAGSALQNNSGANVLTRSIPTNLSAPIAGFGVKRVTTGSANASRFFGFLDSGSLQCELRWDGSGSISVTRNGTVVATSANVLSEATWYHIEFAPNIADSGQYDVWVDGVNVLTGTGDLKNTANAFCNQFRFGQIDNQGIQFAFDDMYVIHAGNSSPYPSSRLGDIKVGTYFLTAAGADADWTPLSSTNVSNVDDSPTADDDTTYNSTTTVGAKDTFKATNPGLASSATVHWIQAVAEIRKDDAGANVDRAIIRSNGTYAEGPDFAPSTTYQQMIAPFMRNPDGTVAWTNTTVENTNLQIGYKRIS
jgi:hypothetical protein